MDGPCDIWGGGGWDFSLQQVILFLFHNILHNLFFKGNLKQFFLKLYTEIRKCE